MNRVYTYRCKDHSILTPHFKKYLVEPLMVLVPYAIPANIITIVSNLFVYLAFLLAWFKGASFTWNFILIPSALLIYLIGDHLDGMQAKRTRTSSELGEYCDHVLDTFNNGLVLIMVFVLFDISDLYLATIFLASSYLAHASIFFHQLKTGWLVFEPIGSLEAMLVIIVLLFLSAIPGVYQFLTLNLYGLKIVELILVGSTVGAMMTFIKSLNDAGSPSRIHLLFLVLWISLSALVFMTGNQFVAYTSLILYGSTYIGAIMHGHLVSGKEPFPDVLSVLVLGAIVLTKPGSEFLYFFLLLLILRALFILFRSFYHMKQHWIWTNPKSN